MINDRRTSDRPHNYYAYGYVVATDSFMGGWGKAPGRSLYAVEVSTEAEGYRVMANMKHRPEMKRVRWVKTLDSVKRGMKRGDHLSVVDKFSAPRFFEAGGFERDPAHRRSARHRRRDSRGRFLPSGRAARRGSQHAGRGRKHSHRRRHSRRDPGSHGKIAATHIRLDRGGYAPSLRHRYFGAGEKLYMLERETADGYHFMMVRAPSAKVARERAHKDPHHWGGWRSHW
jgi:hypothetical protein